MRIRSRPFSTVQPETHRSNPGVACLTSILNSGRIDGENGARRKWRSRWLPAGNQSW